MVSLKQRKVVQLMQKSENIGKPIGTLMREAGYKESVALTPARMTDTKSWAELVKELLPDRKVLGVVDEQLTATKHDINGDVVSDNQSRLRAAELAARLKGKLSNDGNSTTNVVVVPILGGLSTGRLVTSSPPPVGGEEELIPTTESNTAEVPPGSAA